VADRGQNIRIIGIKATGIEDGFDLFGKPSNDVLFAIVKFLNDTFIA